MLRHFQPLLAFPARRRADLHRMSGLFAEQLRQRFVAAFRSQHQQWRHAAIQIMLRDESLHDLVRGQIFGMIGKETLVAQMPPAAHHRQIHANQAILPCQRDDICIGRAAGRLDKLLLLHGVQRPQLVAQGGRLFVMLLFGRPFHRCTQVSARLPGAALQQQHRIADVGLVILVR